MVATVAPTPTLGDAEIAPANPKTIVSSEAAISMSPSSESESEASSLSSDAPETILAPLLTCALKRFFTRMVVMEPPTDTLPAAEAETPAETTVSLPVAPILTPLRRSSRFCGVVTPEDS